jgi:oxygen-independent coproporphyrinogen-3 oxidase
MRLGTLQLQTLPPLSLYIHLPWCLKKCPYCDFNSHELRSPEQLPLLQKEYVQALIFDLEQSLEFIWGRSVQTVFIGGGTPSLFEPEMIDLLLSQIRARVKLAANCEITLEANPGTFERHRFNAFKAAGVTRLSVGVQSFDDQFLSVLGRVHNKAQAIAAIQEAAQSFQTFNLDLMYALPGQSFDAFKEDLNTALSFDPPHLSIYHLTLEPNTYFAKYPPNDLPDEDCAFDMLDLITQETENKGFSRYEVSAFAKPGHQCHHNLNYWHFGDYLGIGAGAHSKLSFAHRIVRQVRIRDPKAYACSASEGMPIAQHQEISRKSLPFEFMLNALRLKDGFDFQEFLDRTGLPASSVQKQLKKAVDQGFLNQDNSWLKPTVRGFDFLNDLTSLFLED